MYNHEPNKYICPFCTTIIGIENEYTLTKQSDVLYKDDFVSAFINAGFWKNNKGHVLIVPNKHFENIYDLPNEYSDRIQRLEKQIAIAFKKVYKCDGVSSRQHNEPYGSQDVWHYHLHVFPRYKDDNFYHSEPVKSTPKERKIYADKLRKYFEEHRDEVKLSMIK